MFTFGIFTTHLPYIAFVVIYAWFFLFGINSPVSEDLVVTENKITIELPVAKVFNGTDNSSVYFYQSDFDLTAHLVFEESIFKRKLSHQCSVDSGGWQYHYSKSHFSRPPPFLS